MNKQHEVLCPICSDNHNHIKRVIVYHGKDDPRDRADMKIEVNSSGDIKTRHKQEKLGYRLAGISEVTLFNCEQGHGWGAEVYTHKGNCSLIIHDSTKIDRR